MFFISSISSCAPSLYTSISHLFVTTECSLADLSPTLNIGDVNRLCKSFSGGVVCYSGDHVGSEAVYFCDGGYSLDGDSTRQCLSSGHWNGTTPLCTPSSGNSE